MKYFLKITFLLLTYFSAFSQPVLDRQVTATSGDYKEDAASGLSLSFTLGEMAVQTWEQGNLKVTEGFQQVHDIIISTKYLAPEWGLKIYPNPVDHQLTIEMGKKSTKPIQLELLDVAGRLLFSDEIIGPSYRLQMKPFPNALYFLKLTEGKQSTTLRILKHSGR